MLTAIGLMTTIGSRVVPSIRAQITRSLTFELAAGREVARYWVFDAPHRRATTHAGHADSPDCSVHFSSSGQALRSLASPRAVERIVADYQRDRVRIDGSLLVLLWFHGLIRHFVRIGRTPRPPRPVPHAYLRHDPSTTGVETVLIEPPVTRLDPDWRAAWNARSSLWIVRAATDEPMPEP